MRELYGANVVGAPRAGIDPLLTVARQDDRLEPRGALKYILEGEPDLPEVTSAPAPAMSGTRSSEVKARVGLDLSAHFLTALGLPVPGAEVTATLWDGATKFAFEVRDVLENQVDLAELARTIDGEVIADNAATSIFLSDASQQLLLVTRTLTATTFAARAGSAGGQTLGVSVDAVSDLIGKANADVSWKREKDDWVSFHGPVPVTFGFSVVPCIIGPDRRLKFGLTRKDLTFGVKNVQPVIASVPAIAENGRVGIVQFE
ncbi:hypothetical protein ACPPVT_18830 [Angustibacter sp. McL0619]|uniref:gasdermin n=1 Tax=Angustibacter sp. McL0619 TaxID=3415676 RepID=UPI003CF66BB5